MVKHGFELIGQLSQHPFGELLREAAASGLSGAFRLAQARVKSVVYFDAGNLLFAVSNVRSHRLSECARRWNFVTQQQLAVTGADSTDAETRAALLESRALTPESLSELLVLQMSSVLRPMLLWTEGTWTFDPRVRMAEDIRVRLDTREMLLESARRLPPEFVATRFGNTNELVSVNVDPPMELALQPVEAFIFSRIAGAPLRLHELIPVIGLPEADTINALYPLALGGFVDRDRWPRAFSDETVTRFKTVDAAVAKKESVATTEPITEKPVVPAAPKEKMPEPEVSREEEIDRFFFRVESAEDFYEVLAVTKSSDASAVKKAYHALARRFHPDRFHQEAGSPLHMRLQTTFARVAQAYEMLKDSKLRASYDLKLQAEKRMRMPNSFSPGGKMSAPSTQQNTRTRSQSSKSTSGSQSSSNLDDAEQNFQKGMAALELGNTPLAIAHFAQAVRREPEEARYRAHYGRSLASNKQTRHQAEAELKAAISLDANNHSYRLMLAELYREYGMKRRAQGEAQKVLAVDPYNVDALRLLQALNMGD